MTPLAPSAVEGRFRSRGRAAWGFGTRFVVMLTIGLVWLAPAWWWPKLIAAMFLWDAAAVGLWLADWRRLPAPGLLEARRSWSGPLRLGQEARVWVQLRNGGRIPVVARVTDALPSTMRERPAELELEAAAGGAAGAEYGVAPRSRGDIRAGEVYVRYRSVLGLAERWAVADLSQGVRVLPDLEQARHHALYLIRSRQVEMERRRRRQRGTGREFETLREYRLGDEMRDICWTASARRHQLTTRLYESERSQAVWIVMDAGRLLRAEVRGAAKLDYAVNAALSLAQVASQSGDRVGLLAYGRTIQQSVGAGRGPQHLRNLVDALALVHGEAAEANHGLAVRTLLRTQTRRSLVVWLTDVAETPMTPEVIEYAMQMTRRHVVVFAVMSHPEMTDLARAVPRDEEEMFRNAAALEIMERRELLLGRLRQGGVMVVDLAPGALAAALVNQYLDIKERSLL